MSLETADRKILVFLPQPAARSIVIRLGQHGYAAVAMSTIPDVFEALRANEFIFAVTTRPDITLLRNIRAIPVINLEIFFHAEPTDNGSVSGQKRFDGKAFIDRVEFLSRPTPSQSNDDQASDPQSVPHKEGAVSRWWTRVMAPWRQARHGVPIADVRT